MKAIPNIFKERFARSLAFTLIFCTAALACLSISLYFFFTNHIKGGMIALLFLLIVLVMPVAERLIRICVPTACYALLLFLCVGALLGSTMNFYFLIPFWDIILHTLSGWLFACIGYAICIRMFPKDETKSRFPYIFFGVIFSLALAVLWELFEAGASWLLPLDMQEDTLVHAFRSFYLSGTHDAPIELQGITETVIHFGDDEVLVVPGYLDLGLADTLSDMAVCLGGSLLFLAIFPLDRLLGGRLAPLLLPRSAMPVYASQDK